MNLYAYKYWKPLGKPAIPPLPNAIIMTDRATGIEYLLTQDDTPNFVLSTASWPTPDVEIFGPFDGPWLPGGIRLYVASGQLQGEFASLPPVNNQRVITRSGKATTLIEVTAPSGWTPGNALQYNVIDIKSGL